MMKISPSMLDSHWWYLNSDYKSREEYINSLKKVRFEPNEAMQKGIDFEDYVCKYPEKKGTYTGRNKDKYEACAEDFWDQVKGGIFQQRLKSDVIVRDTVMDLKFVKSYEVGKYQYSAQWRTYLYATGLPSFIYLVSNGRDNYEEEYSNGFHVERELQSIIGKFLMHLEGDKEAKEAYYKNWRA